MAGVDLNLRSRVTCPFNPAHVMNYSKFHNHFIKCQKNYPNDNRKPCPYNYSELINPEEFDKHVTICPFKPHLIDNSKKIFVEKAPVHIEFDESSEPLPSNLGESQFPKSNGYIAESDEEIDSVSVIAEKCLSGQIKRSISNSTINSAPKLGRGRGAFLRELYNLSNSSQSHFKEKIEAIPVVEDDVNNSIGFSWICKENIVGEKNSLPKSTTNPHKSDISSKETNIDTSKVKNRGCGRGAFVLSLIEKF